MRLRTLLYVEYTIDRVFADVLFEGLLERFGFDLRGHVHLPDAHGSRVRGILMEQK
jgi:hypothetical protein